MKQPKKPRFNKPKAFEDTKKYFGLPPYNVPGNFLYQDQSFANEITKKYGKSVDELFQFFNFSERVKSARIATNLLREKFEYNNQNWKDIL